MSVSLRGLLFLIEFISEVLLDQSDIVSVLCSWKSM